MSTGGFKSPNYTQVPNDLFEAKMKEMDECELRVVLCLVRQTIGYHRDNAKYSISKICEMTGLSRASVVTGATRAEERGLIKRTNKESNKGAEWEIVIDPPTDEPPPTVEGDGTPDLQPLEGDPPTVGGLVGLKKELKKQSLNKEKEKNEKIIKIANNIVDGILESDRMAKLKWAGRESMPEPIRELLDYFVEITGIKPVKNNLSDWLQTGQDWLDLGINKAHIFEAYKKSRGDDKSNGFMVTRPGSLTAVAQAMRAQNRPQYAGTNERIAEKLKRLANR